MKKITEIEELIKFISKLPGLGPKSAQRIILKLVNNKEEIYKPLINSMANVFKNVLRCNNCGSLKSNNSSCENCENKDKKINKICVVETIADQWSIQSSNVFNGYFHILGGTMINSKKNDKLMITELINSVKKFNIDEVILATSVTIEGQTTLYYIQDSFKNAKIDVKISKLGQGIPMGGEIENLDDGTLITAFNNRKEII